MSYVERLLPAVAVVLYLWYRVHCRVSDLEAKVAELERESETAKDDGR